MELHWNYYYYQLWTDNKQMVEEIMVVKDKKDKDGVMNDMLAHQDQAGLYT